MNYRRYRNTDPPALVEVWNETLQYRGNYSVRIVSTFERWLFSKPYFTPNDLIIVEDPVLHRIAGFALVGQGPNEERTALSKDVGVICAIVVRPEFQRRGIGRELLQRAEANLRDRGISNIVFGSMAPNNPYLFGLYGGCNSPGVLESDLDAEPFLQAMGYERQRSRQIFQKMLDSPLTVADTRFNMLRRRYEAQTLRIASVSSWWEECIWGTLEPVEVRMIDKLTDIPAARALIWELEGFSWKWNYPSAGILDVQVRDDLRRQGLGKLLTSQVMRFLQDQFFAVCELHISDDDEAALALCQGLGFEQIDVGHTYVKRSAE